MAASQPSIKNSNATSNLYLGPGGTNVPGMTNVYFASNNFIDGIKALIAAHKINDKEGIVENTLRVIQAPFCFSNAFMQCIYNALYAGVYLKILHYPSLPFALGPTAPFFLAISIAGFIFCVFEGVLETFGLIRTISFFNEIHPTDIEELNLSLSLNDPKERQLKFSTCIQKILKHPLPDDLVHEVNSFLEKKDLSEAGFQELANKISDKIERNVYLSKLIKLRESYFQVTPEEVSEINKYAQAHLSGLSSEESDSRRSQILQNTVDSKRCELIRKIHPWLVNEIEESLTEVISGLQSSEKSKQEVCKEKARALFANIKIQSQKKMFVHTLGIIAVVVTLAGLIAGCISCPIFIPFLLLAVGTALAVSRSLVHWGYMNTKGWDFSIKNCIEGLVPESIREFFNKPEVKLPPAEPYEFTELKYRLPEPIRPSPDEVYKDLIQYLYPYIGLSPAYEDLIQHLMKA